MKVEEVMTAKVACCRPEDSENLVAQIMWDNDCGVVPVVDAAGRAVGMITDRDVCMAAYTQGRPLSELSVADAMSSEVVGCLERDSLEDALGVMRRHGVRRLPVLDRERHVVGLLSMNDAVRATEHVIDPRQRESLMGEMLETLGAVCEHRHAPADVPKSKVRVQPQAPKSQKSSTVPA